MRHRSKAVLALKLALVVGCVTSLQAQARQGAQAWLEECRQWGDRNGRAASACDVRETTIARLNGHLRIDARPNGGVVVTGWDRSDVLVRAKIRTQARSESRAQEILDQISISTSGDGINADGPRREGRESWSVSFEVFAPRSLDLSLTSVNGGLRVLDVSGALELQTTNGGITLDGVAGRVNARTTNGGIRITLTGQSWVGDGLEARSTNGSVRVNVPEGYSAHLETTTRNGGIDIGFPIQVQGRIGRTLSADIGQGGATIRARTTNGSVRIVRN